jgi:hypothetical protein
MTTDTERDLRRRAERRADAKIGFRIHVLIYVLVNAGLVVLNLLTSPDHLWFIWPMLGWGIGLLGHGLGVYAIGSHSRERMIEDELRRLREGG